MVVRSLLAALTLSTLLLPAGGVFADADYATFISYTDTRAYGGAYQAYMPYQGVGESVSITPGPVVHSTKDFQWGRAFVSDSLTSSGFGSNLVTFPAEGGDQMLEFVANGTAATNVSAGIGHLHGSVTASANLSAAGYTYTARHGGTAHYESSLNGNAGGSFLAGWRDGIKVEGGSGLVTVRAYLRLDAGLVGVGSEARTTLNVIIESPFGSYYGPNGQGLYAKHLTIENSIGADGTAALPTDSESFLEFDVIAGSTLWVTQDLYGSAGATARPGKLSAFAMVDASHTALFRIEAVNASEPVTFTASSGLDVTAYAVPEPASLGLLAVGGAVLLRRRR